MTKVTSIVLNVFTNDSRVLKQNVSLVKYGFDVKILALYKEGFQEFEIIENIPVYRLKSKNTNSLTLDKLTTSIYKRLLKNLHRISARILNKYFYVSRIQFNMMYAKACKDSDIVHCNDLSALPIGVMVKKFYNKNVKLVYDAHEYETEINGHSERRKKKRRFLEKWLLPYTDNVMTVSNSIANEYVRLYGIQKPSLVLNTPHYVKNKKTNNFRDIFSISPSKTIFLYQGALVKGRGIENILDVFSNIQNKQHVVVFMGYGSLEEEILHAVNKHDNIFFHPAVSPDVLLNYTSSADFGISMIEDICLSYRYCLPNKMFEYIMAEVPVIVSNLPEMKKIVQEYGLGVVAMENGSTGLEKAIDAATNLNRTQLNVNIQKAKHIFNWEEQEKVFISIYKSLEN